MSDLIARLRAWYDESVDDCSQMDGIEPEFECNYCHRRDVGPSHAEECIAVDCRLAADEIEQLQRKAERLAEENRKLRDEIKQKSICINYLKTAMSDAICDIEDKAYVPAISLLEEALRTA